MQSIDENLKLKMQPREKEERGNPAKSRRGHGHDVFHDPQPSRSRPGLATSAPSMRWHSFECSRAGEAHGERIVHLEFQNGTPRPIFRRPSPGSISWRAGWSGRSWSHNEDATTRDNHWENRQPAKGVGDTLSVASRLRTHRACTGAGACTRFTWDRSQTRRGLGTPPPPNILRTHEQSPTMMSAGTAAAVVLFVHAYVALLTECRIIAELPPAPGFLPRMLRCWLASGWDHRTPRLDLYAMRWGAGCMRADRQMHRVDAADRDLLRKCQLLHIAIYMMLSEKESPNPALYRLESAQE